MKLYLVQHGEAADEAVDPRRPLTSQGREDVARVAAFIQRAGVEVHQIRHSGKLRAEQTAAIFGDYLKPAGGVVAVSGLNPKDDVHPIAAQLRSETRPVMLVGHQPSLEGLAGLLLCGDRGRLVVEFERGGVVCLGRNPDSGVWSLQWAVTPGLIPPG